MGRRRRRHVPTPPRQDRADALPPIAPHESCISCLKGDTTTGFVVRGEAEFAIVVLSRGAGIPVEEAERIILWTEEREHGTDPGKVRTGVHRRFFRLCRACAERTGIFVVEEAALKSGDPVREYDEEDWERQRRGR